MRSIPLRQMMKRAAHLALIYAFALQTLLTLVVATQAVAATPDATVLCSLHASPQQPDGAPTGAMASCCVLCVGPSGTPPSDAPVSSLPVFQFGQVVHAIGLTPVAHSAPPPRDGEARAPPVLS